MELGEGEGLVVEEGTQLQVFKLKLGLRVSVESRGSEEVGGISESVDTVLLCSIVQITDGLFLTTD